MASIALGAVGAFIGGMIGGPIGANLGWMLGAAAGSALDPQKIEGPRLTDLKLQTSGYGRSIPIVYGTKRIAGNVIWQTDLTEHQHTSGGKGGPEVTSYTYTASFAVLLCEGPIGDVTRAWADGRLVYDRTPGAPVSVFPFTLYLGTETQDVDPTMQGILGVDNVPAHRGTAYVVFDDIDLSAYGQRIPNLEFEVVQVSRANAAMSIVSQVIGPVHFRAGFPSRYGDAPNMLSFDPSESGRVRIKAATSVYEYGSDLVYIETVPATIDDERPIVLATARPGGGILYYSALGRWLTGGVYIDIWAQYEYPVGHSEAPGFIGIGNPGIPTDEYIGGGCLTADGTGLFLFTAPSSSTGSAIIDKWYLAVDGSVIDSGTINPPLAASQVAFGSSASNDGSNTFGAMSAENGRRYLWQHWGALSQNGGLARVYWIDGAGNMEQEATVGTCDVDGDVDDDYALASGIAFADGYFGVITGKTLTVFTRFPAGESLYAPLADILSDISDRAGLAAGEINVTGIADLVRGYVIPNQTTARSAIEPLQAAYFFDPVESDGAVKFVTRGSTSIVSIADDDLAAYAGDAPPPLLTTVRQQEIELPRAVDVVYVNALADYQEGNQRAIRQGTSSQTMASISLPIVMTDLEAKAIADRTLYTSWQEREKFKFSTSRKFAKYEPTDVMTASGRAVRIMEKAEGTGGVIEWTGVASIAAATFVQASVPGTGEGFIPQTPPSIQGTILYLLDLPLMMDTDAPSGFYAAMNGSIDTNWRGATLFRSVDEGVNYVSVTSSTLADRVGETTTTLGDWAGGNWFDETNAVTVQLTPGSAALTSSSELGVLNGANMCVIGSEVLQYKNATLTSLRTYVLSGLLRGRRGTDWAQSTHATGDIFVALPASVNVDSPESEIGLSRIYKAVTSGLSLAAAVATDYTNAGIAIKPLSPCQIGGGRDGSGNITINWCRRSRYGGDGMLDVDPIVGEESELYTVTVYATSGYATVKRTITATTTTATYSSADQTTDFGSNQTTIYIAIAQQGSRGMGYSKRGTV